MRHQVDRTPFSIVPLSERAPDGVLQLNAPRARRAVWSGVPAVAPAAQARPERRRNYRHEVVLPVEIQLEHDRVAHEGTTRMLSLGGAFLESATVRPAYGARVRVRFGLPSVPATIDITGVVRWSDARGFGLCFDGLRAHAVWALGKYFEGL